MNYKFNFLSQLKCFELNQGTEMKLFPKGIVCRFFINLILMSKQGFKEVYSQRLKEGALLAEAPWLRLSGAGGGKRNHILFES